MSTSGLSSSAHAVPEIQMVDRPTNAQEQQQQLPPDTDTPMADVEYEVRRTSELTDDLKAQVLALNTELYPSPTPAGVGIDHVFALRGTDHPGSKSKFRNGKKQKAVIGVPALRKFMGEHLETPLKEALEAEAGAAEKSQGASAKSQDQGKGKTSQPQPKPQPEDHPIGCVKVALHHDSQTPHIEIRARLDQSDRIMSLRLYAADIDLREEDNRFGYTSEAGMTEHYTEGTPQLATLTQLSGMQKHGIHRITIRLRETKKRQWSGITIQERKYFRAKELKDTLSSQLIFTFDSFNEFDIFVSVPWQLA